MAILQFLRAFVAAHLDRLPTHGDLDRARIQLAVASRTSFRKHDYLHHRNSGLNSRPAKKREPLSESLAIYWIVRAQSGTKENAHHSVGDFKKV